MFFSSFFSFSFFIVRPNTYYTGLIRGTRIWVNGKYCINDLCNSVYLSPEYCGCFNADGVTMTSRECTDGLRVMCQAPGT